MCTTESPAHCEAFVRFHLAGKSSALPQLHLLCLDGKHATSVQSERKGGKRRGGEGSPGLEDAADWGLNLSMSR